MWSSSSLLAEMLAATPVRQHLTGAFAVEIGAGTAVCGLAAAVRGSRVVVTDSSDQALELVMKSAELNGVAERVACR